MKKPKYYKFIEGANYLSLGLSMVVAILETGFICEPMTEEMIDLAVAKADESFDEIIKGV
ncbi:hypothetical protein [Helicobacter pylori]|uniref:hypothetical protein n=1 Tax=Helicobacter pylori TaxID=210 RepID=UPI00398F3E1A